MESNTMFAPLSPEEATAAERSAPKAASKTPIVPVPDDAPAMAFKHPKLGEPSWSWPYHDAGCRLVGYVCRWDFVDAEGVRTKEILPVTYCDLGGGKRGWRSKGIPAQRPLLGLPAILSRPDAPIVISEGEKARDAVEPLFPDMVATTPAHGAKSPHLTDFSPVAGRIVVISTDYDEAGRKDAKGKPLHPGQDFGDKVCELVRAAGATEVLHLRPERLANWQWIGEERIPRGASIPDGWDVADAIEEGWTADRIAVARQDAGFLTPYLDAKDRAATLAIASGLEVVEEGEEGRVWPFRIVHNGVEKRVERTDKETGIVTVEWKWFCSELTILADTRSSEGIEWGRLIQLRDRDGRLKTFAMAMSMLAGDGTAYREHFLSLGLDIAPGTFARNALHEYLTMTRPDAKVRCVPRTGWQGKAYVMFDETLGHEAEGERHIVQTTGAVDHAYRQKGTLHRWQENVARLAVGNSRLVLAISTAFAAPLLYPTGSESGGFHFRGASSTGKSTALVVAGSVWGGGGIRGFTRTWRLTSNGAEGTAANHSDGLLCLDEMSQVDGKEAGAVAYMLANGHGKTRAGRSGEARPSAEWRLLFLSTGEIGLADKIAEDGRGRRAAAGQEVRIVDIPADAGSGMGMFENIHGFPSATAFADHLKMAATDDYGFAAREFLKLITEDFDAIGVAVASARAEFMAKHCPAKADGQVQRVASRFALVAAGGEMASAFGIVPWEEGEAERAAAKCLSDWLAVRGGVEPAEEREAISTVRRFIEAHGNSRFEAMGSLAPRDGAGCIVEQRTINRVGFRRPAEQDGIEHLVLPEAWKTEICAGLDAGLVARVLARRGILRRDGQGKNTVAASLPGFSKTQRVYAIGPNILTEDDHGDA